MIILELQFSLRKKLEAQRRYILAEKTYESLAREFKKFKGFSPLSSEPGRNEPMIRSLAKYQSFLDRKVSESRYDSPPVSPPSRPMTSVDHPQWGATDDSVAPTLEDGLQSRSGAMISREHPKTGVHS